MNFISLHFSVLFLTFLLLAWLWRNALWHKLLLLTTSCVFYAFWDWRFLSLLFFVTLTDYFISIYMYRSNASSSRKKLLFLSIFINLLILGYFKYFNFFIETFNLAFARSGVHLPGVSIVLPVGISFYVFESISYIIDVYRGVTQPTYSLLDYAVFITFFPRLVAGPIMRAAHFLPQLNKGLHFNPNQTLQGVQMFAQGMIKKVVVADAMALLVDMVYKSPTIFSSVTVYLGVFAYSVQIYFDFSGYSDMAIGIAKILGFDLPENFNLPYLAQNLTEFWRRWHISLSLWLRDYMYFSLGGNRKGKFRTYINLLITMLLGGLWHGASWNFVFWGGIHGVGLIFERLLNRRDVTTKLADRNSMKWAKVLFTFVFISFSWVFFRSPSIETTKLIFEKLFFIQSTGVTWFYLPALVYIPIVMIGGGLVQKYILKIPSFTLAKPYAIPVVLAEFLFAFLFSATSKSPFIYFQF